MNSFKIGITHGDMNGIGYEVIIKTLQDPRMLEICTPVVYGLSKVASFHRKTLNIKDFSFNFVKNIQQASPKKANLLNLKDDEVKVNLGESTKIAGEMSELALHAAVKGLKANEIDAVVTAPIDKFNVQSKTFNYTGHTEFFSSEFNTQDTAMMMISDRLKLAFVTNHIPINELSQVLSKELIINKIKIVNNSLQNDFLIRMPKIAVLSLNPHAGDHNLIGNEESEVIIPAIKECFDNKMNVFGPFPADGFFASGDYTQYDVVLAMYHDQGMLPFKLLSFDSGVNYTAGLPVVRTSPAHGTAFGIAGKNQASPSSLRSAIYLAVDILRNRKKIALLKES